MNLQIPDDLSPDFAFCFFGGLNCPELYDPFHKVKRDRLVMAKLYGSFSTFILGKLFFKNRILPRRRIYRNEILISSKIHHILPIHFECWYVIADRFFHIRNCFFDQASYLLHLFLNLLRESSNVFVNIFRIYILHIRKNSVAGAACTPINISKQIELVRRLLTISE